MVAGECERPIGTILYGRKKIKQDFELSVKKKVLTMPNSRSKIGGNKYEPIVHVKYYTRLVIEFEYCTE